MEFISLLQAFQLVSLFISPEHGRCPLLTDASSLALGGTTFCNPALIISSLPSHQLCSEGPTFCLLFSVHGTPYTGTSLGFLLLLAPIAHASNICAGVLDVSH